MKISAVRETPSGAAREVYRPVCCAWCEGLTQQGRGTLSHSNERKADESKSAERKSDDHKPHAREALANMQR